MQSRKRLVIAAAALAVPILAVTQTAAQAGAGSAVAHRTPPRALTAAAAAALARNANKSVVVFLKTQPAVHGTSGAVAAARSSVIATAQAPLISELTQVRAKNVRSYHLFNAVAATVSAAEAARLASNPSVAAVIPNEAITGPTPAQAARSLATATGGTALPVLPGTCGPNGQVQLEPEGLSLIRSASDNPSLPTAATLGITGKGVKVAYMAEGIDVNNPDFIRANGQHVFVAYKDFSGDGPNAPTTGGEAFLDATSIAAQGRQVYDISHFGAHPLPTPCNIRILGVSPGASLVGLKVFASNNQTTTSAFLQAIDYAVNVAHVDVLNESFGNNGIPDVATLDAVKLFDEAAVQAGVTVTVSSGDAGPTSTIGSPATDPAVIDVGGSTDFRWYAQTNYGAARQFATTGWLNDNITSLSSGGYTQDGRLIDLVAPGDSSFALCTPSPTYADCVDFTGNPSNVERSGGTSQSAPIVAGAAADVIQAFRKTHGGASPTPATVKQILTSTADDLGYPSYEQGSGRLNVYKAVLAAESWGNPTHKGNTLVTSTDQLNAIGTGGSAKTWTFQVQNTGASTQTVKLSGRAFTPAAVIAQGSVTLSDSGSQFADWSGVPTNYAVRHFTVSGHPDRLTADLAYPGNPANGLNARVRLILIDPLGRYAAHSLPQGVGNAGHVDVRYPAAGTWTAVIFSRESSVGGTVGKVVWRASTANFTSYGSVSPSSLTLAPGATGTVTVHGSIPSAPGDTSAAVVLNAGAGGTTTVGISTRSLVNLGTGGNFSGLLTGGNGRETVTGQTNWYQFNVPPGQRDLDAKIALKNDPGNPVFAYLVAPSGQALGYAANRLFAGVNNNGLILKPQKNTNLYVQAPAAGRWTLIVNFADFIVGNEISQPFSGSITTNRVQVAAPGLPNSAGTVLKAGKPVNVNVLVRNTGTAPENFFVDARLAGSTVQPLTSLSQSTGLGLPLSFTTNTPQWIVPTETFGLGVAAAGSVPVTFDFGPFVGDPDLYSGNPSGNVATASLFASPISQGLWYVNPSEIGPYGSAGAPPATVDLSMLALMRPFDAAVFSPVPDLWQASVNPATSIGGVTVQPGHVGVVPVTIVPIGKKGSVVRGTLFVDDVSLVSLVGAGVPGGDELAGISYTYRIG